MIKPTSDDGQGLNMANLHVGREFERSSQNLHARLAELIDKQRFTIFCVGFIVLRKSGMERLSQPIGTAMKV